MQKRVVGLALVLVSLLILSSVIVSAFSFSDLWNDFLGKKTVTGNVVSSSSATNCPANVCNGLVAWYRGEGDAGDSSGNANDAVASGAVTYSAGKSGNAFNFGAPIGRVTTPVIASKTFTWSFWVKASTFAPVYQSLLTVGWTGTKGMLLDLSYNTVSFWTGEGYSAQYFGTGKLTADKWYNFVLVREGDSVQKGYKFYLDGVLMGTLPTAVWSPDSQILIGDRFDASSQPYNGLIDEVALYNRALSADEVKSIYDSASTSSSSGGGGGGGVSSSYDCSSLRTKDSASFTTCKDNNFDNVCFNKNSAQFQGCTRNNNNDCTVNNANSAVNILCPVVAACSDSDVDSAHQDGLNYNVKSSAKGYFNEQETNLELPDTCCNPSYNNYGDIRSCSNGDIGQGINEAYCSGNSVAWSSYICPNGCSDGACIQSTTTNVDRCSELSSAAKAKIDEWRNISKNSGREFVTSEGDKAKKNDYVVMYSNQMRILRVAYIPSNSSSNNKVMLTDAVTGEQFDFYTGIGQTSVNNIDGQTFYLYAYNDDRRVSDLDRYIILTWGTGSDVSNVGSEKDSLNCVAPASTCSDSDGGKDYNTVGSTKVCSNKVGEPCIGFDDQCENNVLLEGYCVDGSTSSHVFYNCSSVGKTCSKGDGACLEKAETKPCMNILVKSNVDGNGDAINLATSSQKLYENDPINNARSVLTKSELPNLLADGTISDNAGNLYDYRQMISIGSSLITTSSSGELMDPQLMVQIGTQPQNPIYNYTLVLTKALDVSDPNVIGSAAYILGKQYVIGGTSSVDELHLYEYVANYLLSSAQGENAGSFEFNDIAHQISLDAVTSSSASITVDGVRRTVSSGSEYRFAGEIILYVKSIYPAQVVGQASKVEILVGGRPLVLINGDNVRVGVDGNAADNTRVALSDSNGKLTKIVISQAAQQSTGDYIALGAKYTDRVFGSIDVVFEGLGCLPSDPQVCQDLINEIKNPTGNDERRLNWNATYNERTIVNGNWESYTTYNAAWDWNSPKYEENKINYYYANYEIQVFDNKNVDLSEFASWNKNSLVCRSNSYWVNSKENNYYICNWDALYGRQSTSSYKNSNRQIFWYNNNVVVRMNLYYGQSISDADVAKLSAQRISDLLDNLENNQYKYVDWSNFDIEYPTSNELYNSIRGCSSDVFVNWSVGQYNWNCKTEPVVCPAHGYQTKICTRYNPEKEDNDIETNQIQCSPGMCSGCYEPRWYGSKGDNTCIPYGFRLAHQTGEHFELVERTHEDTIKENTNGPDSDEYSLTIKSENEALLSIRTNRETQNFENFTLIPGKSVEIKMNDGGDIEIIKLNVISIHPAVEGNDGYVKFSVTYTANERVVDSFNAYCDIDGQIKQQITKDSQGNWARCQNNYECSSNVCSDGECIELKDMANQANSFKAFFVKIVCRLSNIGSAEGYSSCIADFGVDAGNF